MRTASVRVRAADDETAHAALAAAAALFDRERDVENVVALCIRNDAPALTNEEQDATTSCFGCYIRSDVLLSLLAPPLAVAATECSSDAAAGGDGSCSLPSPPLPPPALAASEQYAETATSPVYVQVTTFISNDHAIKTDSSFPSSSSSSYVHGKWLEEALGATAGEEEAWETTAAEAAGLSEQQVLYRGSDAGWFVSSAAAAAVQDASGVLASASAALHPFEVVAWQQRVGENTYVDAPSVYVVALGSETVSTLVQSIHAQRTECTMAAADSAIVASRAATESAFESAKCVRTLLFVDCILYPICVSLTT